MKKILIALLCLAPIMAWAQQSKLEQAKSAAENENFDLAITLLNDIKSQPYIQNEEYREVDIYSLLAMVYLVKEDKANTLKILNEALEKFPGDIDLVNIYCMTYTREEKDAEAFNFLDKMMEKYPDNIAQYLLIKGRIYLVKGKFKEAEPLYDLSLKMDGTNAVAMMDIGYYSMEYAFNLYENLDDVSDANEKQQLKTKVIYYLRKAAKNLRGAYDGFTSEERCDTNVLVFLNDVCITLKEDMQEPIDEYVINIDTTNYDCD